VLPVSPMLVPEVVGVDTEDDQAWDGDAIKVSFPSLNPSSFSLLAPSIHLSSYSSFSSTSMAFDAEL
jgi:hypothetical protein